MSERCFIELCKSPSRTQCQCCNKNFCRNHFIEHDNLPNFQLNSLVDEINLLNDRITAFNVIQYIGDSRKQLERWRINCYKIIDDTFKEKCREIDQHVNDKIEQQRNELARMQSTLTELIRKEEATMKDIDLLKTDIHTMQEKINNMEQTCIRVVVCPLLINNNLIRIEELYMPYLELSVLPPPYRRIDHIGCSSRFMANNDRFFLVHQEPNLCLMDRELSVVKRTQLTHDTIWDMCWSSTLARFFVITKNNIYAVDDEMMLIESVQINQNQSWFTCTCSDTSLYLSTFSRGSSIFKFSLLPSIEFEKQWTFPETCTRNQAIMSVVYNNETLALTVTDGDKNEKLIELRSSANLERLWSLKLNITFIDSLCRCCSVNHNGWLVYDYDMSRLLHISKDGKLEATREYNEKPVRLCLFDGSKLAVSSHKSINLHELKSIH